MPGTWLGIWIKTGEKLVAISPTQVVKVRTVMRRPEAERWSSNIIDFLQATPQRWIREGEVEPTGLALDVDELDTGEGIFASDEPDFGAAARAAVPRARRPWISAQQRWEMGRTPGCKGCEALLITEGPARPHNQACWDRIAGILESTEDGKAALDRAKGRMEQYQRIVSNCVAPESFQDIPVPPAAVHWPDGDEVETNNSDDEGAAQAAGPAALEASISQVYARYIEQKPDGKITQEGIRQVFERLDKEMTAKAEQRKHRLNPTQTKNDVSEVYSPPRVTEVAEATGLRAGWALDLTVNKDDGTPWDLSIPENQVAGQEIAGQ